ncbi:hypothetical protein F4808DRAFT_433751 [Astrocystis sublimbata]|nr:hypothetical protein F4808DRAFT_433751 [Astrocystis sublimbata]
MASPPSAPTIPTASTVSHSQPPTSEVNPLIHTVALGVTPLSIIALFLPPRRMDLRTVLLGGVAVWGTNQLAHDYSGQSFAQRFNSRMASVTGSELPEKARATQARLREEKERRQKLRALRDEMVNSGVVKATGDGLEGWTEQQKRALLEAYERQRREEQQGSADVEKTGARGVLGKVWMGDAPPDWKEKRDQKEKEALQEGGGGYIGLIMDQIGEVWSGSKPNEGDASKQKADEISKKS